MNYKTALLFLAASSFFSAAGWDRRPASNAPGDFDYYVLAMSWSPQHCATKGANDRLQCGEGREYGFILHGLWPQYEQGWPEDCSTRTVSRDTIDEMLPIMPSPGLIRHEWSKHGTCSGLTAPQYFAKARDAYNRVRIPNPFKSPRERITFSPASIRKEFTRATPGLPENAVAVLCTGRFVQEVRVCMTKDLQPRKCSDEVARNQCNLSEIIFRPVR